MSYDIIKPPFTLQFKEMDKKELKDYSKWFHEVRPTRIQELTRAIKHTHGFEQWEPDVSPESLNDLGAWFASKVSTRERSLAEIEEIESRLPYPIEIEGVELTNMTFSLAIDVGMYLSEVFLRNYPTIRWDQQFGSKNFVDYGQPVLVGFGVVPFNPVRVAITLAYGIAKGQSNSSRLREIYNIWAEKVSEPNHITD